VAARFFAAVLARDAEAALDGAMRRDQFSVSVATGGASA
jgi:hypothetical protein